jgi:uncharacterized protein
MIRGREKGAEHGDAEAQFNLGVMYGDGLGVSQDYVRAHLWFNLAVSNGVTETIQYRDFLVTQMTQIQLRRVQELARNWRPK